MLVWNSFGQDKSREAVMGRFIDETGRLSENEVLVNTNQDHSQIHPTLTAAADKYIVAWSTPRSGDTGFDIVGQRYVAQDAKPLLPAIADIFVNPVSENELFVSWPEVKGLNIKHYELFHYSPVQESIEPRDGRRLFAGRLFQVFPRLLLFFPVSKFKTNKLSKNDFVWREPILCYFSIVDQNILWAKFENSSFNSCKV